MRNIRRLLENHLIILVIPGGPEAHGKLRSCAGQEVPVQRRKTNYQVLSFEVPAPTVHPVHPEPNLLKPVLHAPSLRWMANER